ncbi:hypothetical protein ACRAWD_29885 [Caulobacter segnis]
MDPGLGQCAASSGRSLAFQVRAAPPAVLPAVTACRLLQHPGRQPLLRRAGPALRFLAPSRYRSGHDVAREAAIPDRRPGRRHLSGGLSC